MEISVWNCRKELVLWCSRKLKIVEFFGKCALLEELGFRQSCVLDLIQ